MAPLAAQPRSVDSLVKRRSESGNFHVDLNTAHYSINGYPGIPAFYSIDNIVTQCVAISLVRTMIKIQCGSVIVLIKFLPSSVILREGGCCCPHGS